MICEKLFNFNARCIEMYIGLFICLFVKCVFFFSFRLFWLFHSKWIVAAKLICSINELTRYIYCKRYFNKILLNILIWFHGTYFLFIVAVIATIRFFNWLNFTIFRWTQLLYYNNFFSCINFHVLKKKSIKFQIMQLLGIEYMLW